jgi:uncharacterized iron-regulated protein
MSFRSNVYSLFVLTGALLLSACSTSAPKPSLKSSPGPDATLPPLTTLYDYQLIDSASGQPMSLQTLVESLKDVDVVFIGEFHGNQASHLLEAQLQAKLYQQRPNQVVSLEQFNRDQQAILNRYLDGEIGEKTLIEEAPAWSNYAGSYRPIIEFAKQHFLPVIAANAPAQTVRCVGRQGQAYLAKLTEAERRQIAQQAFYSDPAYADKFAAFLAKSRHGQSEQSTTDPEHNPAYLAQLVRDNTMAESIFNALQHNPGAQVIHLNGAFHSDEFLGTASALKHLNPALKIAVISPVVVDDPQTPQFTQADRAKGNAIYLIQAQPEDYVQAAKRRAAFKKMFDKADANPCR